MYVTEEQACMWAGAAGCVVGVGVGAALSFAWALHKARGWYRRWVRHFEQEHHLNVGMMRLTFGAIVICPGCSKLKPITQDRRGQVIVHDCPRCKPRAPAPAPNLVEMKL